MKKIKKAILFITLLMLFVGIANKGCICLGCGRRVRQIAVDVHKKCPFCDGTSFRPLDEF